MLENKNEAMYKADNCFKVLYRGFLGTKCAFNQEGVQAIEKVHLNYWRYLPKPSVLTNTMSPKSRERAVVPTLLLLKT